MKNHSISRSIIIVLALLGMTAIAGCSSSRTEKAIDQQLQAEKAPQSNSEFQYQIEKTIEDAALPADQKTRLKGLCAELKLRHNSSKSEMMKLKLMLAEKLVDPKSKSKEITAIQKRINSLYGEQQKSFSVAVEQAQKILGHDVGPDHRKIYEGLFLEAAQSRF